MFTWVLVAISVLSPLEVDSRIVGNFSSMTNCFKAHEYMLNGQYPAAGTQLVCVKVKVKDS